MAFRLIPREEKFYNDFQALADELMVGARILEEMLAPERPVWDKADEIKEVEHKCDFLTHEIIQRLNRTFVTPLDREDIHALARSLDDVMDAIDDSASLVRLYRLDRIRFGARELAQIITASAKQVRLAIDAMEHHKAMSGTDGTALFSRALPPEVASGRYWMPCGVRLCAAGSPAAW